MNKLIVFIFVLTLGISSCKNDDHDFTPESSIAILLQNTGQAYGKALSVDHEDNFYYTSLYEGNITGKSFTSAGIIDNYLAKHDKHGALIWEKSFGGAGSITVGHGIDIDADKNVYLTGYFGGETSPTSITIDFGSGITTSSASGYDAFVCKYDASGNPEWAFSLGNATALTEERTWDIIVEDDGDFYVSGAFSGTVNFDPLGSTAKNESVTGIGHFLAKYTSDGENIWVNAIEANINNVFTEGYTTVDFDQSGNVFLAGVYRNSLTIGSDNMTSAGQTDFFLASFDASNGNANWAKTFGGSGMDIVSPGAMRVNGLGEPHLTGRFSGTSNFGGTSLTSNSAGNTFVLACNTLGNTKWAIVHSSNSGLDGGHRVDFDAQNQVYVAGWFRGAASFDQSGTTVLTSKGTDNASDVFLAKYNASGQLDWAKAFGAVVSGGENLSICAGLGVDSEGNAIITGKFYGTNADYDPSNTEELMFSSEGMDDCFTVKYNTNGNLYKF
ncbi:MAG: hypothetical protein ACPGJS_08570 [Flammeovirgaceae bacterium]